MFRPFYLCLAGLLAAGVAAPPAAGQTAIFTNPITGTDPGLTSPYTFGQNVTSNLTVSGIGRGTGITGTGANDRYNANSWDTTSIDSTAYFTWSLAPATGYAVDIASLVYASQRSGTGPTSFVFRSSLDNYATDVFATTIAVGTTTAVTTTIPLPSAFQNITTGTTEFRLYGWNASAAAGTYSVNDFTYSGLVSDRWSGATDGNLATATNYVSGVSPVAANGVQFEGSANTAVTVSAATTVAGLRFAAGAAEFTVGGTSTLTLGSAGGIANYSTATQTVNAPLAFGAAQTVNASAGAVDIGGGISGSGSLTKTGAAALTLRGTNTYTGGTTLNAGTLTITNASTGGTALTFSGSSTLNGTGSMTATSFTQSGINSTVTFGASGTTVTASGAFQMTPAVASGNTTNVFNQTGGTLNFNATSATAGTVAVSFSGFTDTATYNLSGGTLNVPNGNLRLASVNTGGTPVGTLAISGTGTAKVLGLNLASNGTGTLTITGGTLNVGTNGIVKAGASATGIVNLGAGTVGAYGGNWSSSVPMTLTSASTGVTFNTLDAVDLTTARTITLSGGLSDPGALVKSGAGTLVLNGGNTYTGPTLESPRSPRPSRRPSTSTRT